MKKEFIEFLSKRLASKIDDLRNTSYSEQGFESMLDDIETYSSTILEIAKEVIKP